MNTKRHQRGAALIVALAILVVLLALGITFLTTSRLELQVATNVEESLRTELLANGGLAIAIAFLQHDLLMHPTYTSLDHAWKSYFSGSWAAGKPWMFPDNRRLWPTFGPDLTGDGQPDPRGPGVPLISLSNLAINLPRSPDGRPLYGTENTSDWLYLPVVMDDPTALFPPTQKNVSGLFQFDRRTNGFYVISEQVAENPALIGPDIPGYLDPIETAPRLRLASELTDIWADVDNTGDGIKDAIWIPVPQDLDFSDDGIDNNLSGTIDEPGEIARFLYWDEQQERVMVTAPLVANGVPVLFNLNLLTAGAIDFERLQARYNLPGEFFNDAARFTVTSAYGHPSVDLRDNDWDFVEGNARTVDLRADLDPANPTVLGQALFAGANPFDLAELRDLFPIHPRYTVGENPFANDLPYIYSSGEPVTEIVGRLAITITDTASRVDIGAIGGFAREASFPASDGAFRRVRSIGEGVSPFEYEPRVLPAFGAARSEKLWNLTVGAPYGLTNEFLPPGQPLYAAEYEFDVRHPGYGLVDDNVNALSLAMDGVDNDGTGLVDPVFSLGSPADSIAVRQRYFASFGSPLAFEGIDEPTEYQRYRPLRNRIAESDGIDNNPPLDITFSNGDIVAWSVDPNRPSIIDEVGELGDLVLRSKEQIKQIVENENFVSGQRLYDIIRNHTTVHATQRTERRRFTNAYGVSQNPDATPVRERGEVTGTKLDLNYASVPQMFNALVDDFGYPSLHEEFLSVLNDVNAPQPGNFPDVRSWRRAQLLYMQGSLDLPLFALGLGIESLNLTGTPLDRPLRTSALGGVSNAWAADERLRAAQLAVNIADFRDSDHNRTTFSFTVPDLWWEFENLNALVPEIEPREIEYTVAGVESIRINEIMVRATRRVEAEMLYGVGLPPAGGSIPGVNGALPVTSRRYLTVDPNLSPAAAEAVRQAGRYDPIAATPTTYQVAPNVQYNSTPQAIFANFDPNYFSIIPGPASNADPSYAAQGFVDFRMTQRAFAWWNPEQTAFDGSGQLRDPSDVFNPVQDPLTVILPGGAGSTATASGGWERVWSKRNAVGNQTALTTAHETITRQMVPGNPGTNIQGPNFMEFEFLPSPGLPPGRYYLKLNTSLLINEVTGAPTIPEDPEARFIETVQSFEDLRFAIKLAPPGQGFVADIAGTYAAAGGGVVGATAANAYISANLEPGLEPVTWRDLEASQDGSLVTPVAYPAQLGIPGFLGAKADLSDYAQGDGTVFLPGDVADAFTVRIPNYTEDLALHIAVWRGPGGGVDFNGNDIIQTDFTAINYFEFSQEPAHEWVEIVNIAEDSSPIDLSGWVLEVGHPEDEGFVIEDLTVLPDNALAFESMRRRFRVPDGTQIVPGGKLLLGFSKFDFLGAPDNLVNSINRNGMALANTGFLPDAATGTDWIPGVNLPEPTVPPIPMGDPRGADPVFWPMGPPLGSQFTTDTVQPGSVFRRVLFDPDTLLPDPFTLVDFVDDTGDGLDDLRSGRLDFAPSFDRAIRPEELGASYNFTATPFDSSPFDILTGTTTNKAFDRIVELEPIDQTTGYFDMGSLNAVARVVLAGGVFPNYPERDGRDNNLSGSSRNAPLLRDRVNNDMNVFFGADNPLLPVDDFRTQTSTTGADIIWPSEGVDQGAPGYYDPITGANLRAPQPGSYSEAPVPYFVLLPNSQIRAYDGLPNPPNSYTPFANALFGGVTPPAAPLHRPEFKAFLERRWNPGDVVKVTLYTGRPSEERIADRVTYIERDVVNRAVHDGIANPHHRWINVNGDELFSPNDILLSQTLDPRFPTMWPDDTMGVDFYRSLERKHPLYGGDMYGSTNRWMATDGNYDDWGAGWGKKDADLRFDPLTGNFVGSWESPETGLAFRWRGFASAPGLTLSDQTGRQDILVGHQFEGSPLRMNFAARQFENPVAPPTIGLGPPEQGARQFQYTNFPSGAAKTRDPYPLSLGFAVEGFGRDNLKRWTWHKPRVRNRNLASGGNLMTMPQMVLQRRLWGGSFISGDVGTPGGTFTIANFSTEPYGTYDDAVNSVILGEQRRRDLTAVTAVSLMEPKILSAGQANVYFLTGDLPVDPTGEFSLFESFDVVRADDGGIFDPTLGLEWPSGTVLTGPGSFPQGWTPVFLYSMPGDGALPMDLSPWQDPGLRSQVLVPIRNNVLMDTAATGPDADFFFSSRLIGPGETVDAQGQARLSSLAERSTLETRVAFWVSGNLDGVNRNALDVAPGIVPPSSAPAEVLFEWTGDAGLENGDYDVYIVTAEPLHGLAEYARSVLDPTFVPPVPLSDSELEAWRSRQQVLARTLTPTALAVLQQAASTVPSSLPVDVEILTDRDGNRRAWSTPGYPAPGDFRAPGIDGEAINPESAGLIKRVTPDSQGVIHYGQVRVENNYLALRLRNWAAPGRLNRFSRVVLTPVNRVRGRLNINTVATVRDTNDLNNRPGPVAGFETTLLPDADGEPQLTLPLFNPLQGLPGVLTASYDELRPALDVLSPIELLRENDPGATIRDINITNLLGLQTATAALPQLNMYDRSIRMADRITQYRPDWGDGRYYRFPSDLVAWEQRVPWQPPIVGNVPYGNEFPHYPSEARNAFAPPENPFAEQAGIEGIVGPAMNRSPLYLLDPERGVNEYGFLPSTPDPVAAYFLNNARFDENVYRFSRIANNITTRSDVFEIVVTAQSGYVPAAGERAQGAINYRNEFVVQGERKLRVVYER